MRKQLLLLLVSISLFTLGLQAQTITVTGKVTDDKGAAVSGASVQEKGTRNGTSANNDGSFTLKAKSGAKLVVSALGFENKEVTAATSVSVSLITDTKSLSEVVVTGVGVATSKKKLAISVESIATDKTNSTPTASVDQFLVGKVAGAQISSTNGSPGAGINILLRGVNTLNRGTTPMVLLDGVQVGATDLNSLDLTNIERVEIVQGAASGTIYGAQGANGVIQLFSKKGKIGKTRIDVTSSAASTELLNIGGVQKAKFHAFATDAQNRVLGSGTNVLNFDNVTGSYLSNVQYSALNVASIANKPYDQNLQWYDHYGMFFQKGYVLNNSIAISGAKDKTDYTISVSNNSQNSNFKNNGDFSRTNFNTNLGIELAKNLRFRSITQLAYTKNTLNDQTGRSIFYMLNNTRPFANYDYKDPDGNYTPYFGDAAGVNGFNPNYINQYTKSNDQKIDVLQNFSLNYKPNKFLDLDAKYGLNYQTQDANQSIASQIGNKGANYWQYWAENYFGNYGNPTQESETGEIDNFRYRTTFQNFLASATFKTDFQKDFGIKLPIKTSTQLAYDFRKNVFQQYITYGLQAPNYTPYTASQMAVYKIQSDYKEPFVTYGYLLNQRFDYGELAGVSGGFRTDYSSAFGAGSKPFTFPRADAYYRLSAMNFWQNSKITNVFSEVKFRGAWGQAGIQPRPFDRYVTLSTRNVGTSNVYVFPTRLPNPNLDVEVSEELEIGTDINVNILKKGNWLKSAAFSLTYWDRKTKNAIWDVEGAASAGVGFVKNNAFGLASNGIQASLNINLLNSKKIVWNLNTIFSKQTSKISSVIGAPVVVTSSAGSSNYVLRAGEKIGQLYGFKMLHAVDEKDANGNFYIPQANHGNYVVASNGWVVDKATKRPFAGPLESLGDPNPKFNMSFINDFALNDYLTIAVQVDWLHGSHIYNQTKSWMYRDGIHKDYADPITIDGTTAAYTAFYRGVYQAGANNGTKAYFYEDASFVRLRNVAVAFDFAKYFKLKTFSKLQLVLSGRNLLTKTKYTGYDPEVSSGTTNSAFDRGVDHNTVPNLKSYQVGLNIGL